jgi:hypothetical protein
MLTLFAIPKPFNGHIGIIQRNAIQSWKLMCPDCEIILVGNDEGTAEVAAEMGLRHVPDIATNQHGTPLVSDIFQAAQRLASNDILGYVNADIMLTGDFVQAVSQVAAISDRFLMVGQRWDVDIRIPWDFDTADWEPTLQAHVREHGKLHPKTGIDYFAFPKDLYEAIPPFAVGRTAWDNWLIAHANKRSALVIDATERVMAIHQDHDYGTFQSRDALWTGEEARENQRLMGRRYGTLDDASHLLLSDGLHHLLTARQIVQHPRRLLSRFPVLRLPLMLVGTLLKRSRPMRAALGLTRAAWKAKRS